MKARNISNKTIQSELVLLCIYVCMNYIAYIVKYDPLPRPPVPPQWDGSGQAGLFHIYEYATTCKMYIYIYIHDHVEHIELHSYVVLITFNYSMCAS